MIPLMKNAFSNERQTREELARFVVDAPRLSMDVQCADFEREFAQFQRAKAAVLFNSGGSANLAMFQALKNLGTLKDGDKVGFSTLTWSTNVMPIIQLGLEPVPIDVEPGTLNVMANTVRERLRDVDRLAALFVTNALGFAGDLDRIRDLCVEEGITLLEDNCEALGTELESGLTGSFGKMASFSFFVAHHLSTIEGGMVCTDDEELVEMLKIVRANGWDRNLTADQQRRWRNTHNVISEFAAKYTFYDLGYNLRPTEITGFLGLTQLRYLRGNIDRRQELYTALEAVIRQNLDLVPPERAHLRLLSPFACPVITRSAELRDRYMAQFSGAGVEIRPMIAGNIQRQPFFRKYVPTEHALVGADFLHDCGFYCGLYPELTESDIETLKSCLLKY